MSRPQTLEQLLLNNANRLLESFSPLYEQRLLVLEGCASLLGGFDIADYWSAFGIQVPDCDDIIQKAERLLAILKATQIPVSLALSSLAREPISISEQKQRGAFYTDFRLAQFIANDCLKYLDRDTTIADIAAGSGILLAAVSERYYDKFPKHYTNWISECVYAFDLSPVALRGARIALSTHCSSVSALKKMSENWRVSDSLLSESVPASFFDIVVGNPPWGKVKLSLNSFLNRTTGNHHVYGVQYGEFDREQFMTEKQDALEYSRLLKERYSLLGDAEPDLYMAFLQRAIEALKPEGHLSYIVPAGIIRSLGTESLRRYLIECSKELKYYLLDNKANFFEIDSRFKFVIISENRVSSCSPACTAFRFEICTGDKSGINCSEEIQFEMEELERIRPDLTVPECRSIAEKDLFVKIYSGGCSWRDEWNVDIAREVDMTNDRRHFHEKRSDSDLPVIEGRMIQQFRFGAKAYISGSGRSAKWIPNVGSVKPQFYISKSALSPQLFKRATTFRAGYCDIAGQTNERAMMSAIVPPGVVCGNKVPTIVFPGDIGEDRLFLFVGVTNSFVFDWLLRRVLSTTVNYFLLFSLPMPNIDISGTLAQRIVALTKSLSNMGNEFYTGDEMGKIRAELDVAVAEAYGLSFESLKLIMTDFPLLDRPQQPINGETRSTYTRDLLLSVAEKHFAKTDLLYSNRARSAAEIHSRAYVPTEMVGLCSGGAK